MTPLEIIRRNNNLSQEELANELGLLQSTISRIERGKLWPKKKDVEKIIIFFKYKITVMDILWPEGFPFKGD